MLMKGFPRKPPHLHHHHHHFSAWNKRSANTIISSNQTLGTIQECNQVYSRKMLLVLHNVWLQHNKLKKKTPESQRSFSLSCTCKRNLKFHIECNPAICQAASTVAQTDNKLKTGLKNIFSELF